MAEKIPCGGPRCAWIFGRNIVAQAEASHDRLYCLPLCRPKGGTTKRAALIRPARPRRSPDASAPRRFFGMARQLSLLAKAAQMGLYADARAIALRGWSHLLAKAKAPDGPSGLCPTR